MRINLIGTLIFSLSGLVTAGLHAHKHFLLPALAPVLYNVGQIIGIVFFANILGLGVHGLAYGVVFGALLHFLIQVPGLVRFGFVWQPVITIADQGVRRVLGLMVPRIATVLCIQIIFIARDNLASRLSEGAVTALTYGYFIQQVPETLIGTAIATALLPTLSQYAEQHNKKAFESTLTATIKIIIALTLLISVIAFVGLKPYIEVLFDFDPAHVSLLVWTSQAFLIGLVSHSLLEVLRRSFYAKQDAKTPLYFTFIRMVLYVVLGIILLKPLGAPGLALADTVVVSIEALFFLFLLRKTIPQVLQIGDTVKRTLLTAGMYAVCVGGMYYAVPELSSMVKAGIATAGGVVSLYFVRTELKMLVKLK